MYSPSYKLPGTVALRWRPWLTCLILGTAGFCVAMTDAFSWGEQPRTETPSVQLHMYIKAKPGKSSNLEHRYRTVYLPIIQTQKGFQASRLLRKIDSADEYEIDIAFASKALRVAWAQSQDHDKAWKKMDEAIAKITVQEFDVLD